MDAAANLLTVEQRLRAAMCEESTIDLDEHLRNIAAAVAAVRKEEHD